jgi:hypothetical protein
MESVYVQIEGREFLVDFDENGEPCQVKERKSYARGTMYEAFYNAPYWSAKHHPLGSSGTMLARIARAAAQALAARSSAAAHTAPASAQPDRDRPGSRPQGKFAQFGNVSLDQSFRMAIAARLMTSCGHDTGRPWACRGSPFSLVTVCPGLGPERTGR